MELHRTEVCEPIEGIAIPVTYIGILRHEGVIRELILGLKYQHQTSHARLLARIVVDLCGDVFSTCDLITWAPTTDVRIRERGLDHAEQIARHVSAMVKIPAKKLLRRTNVGAQTGSSRQDRLDRPHFVARPLRRPLVVVVIDDVVTTGATFHAAANALALAGAAHVVCIAPSRA